MEPIFGDKKFLKEEITRILLEKTGKTPAEADPADLYSTIQSLLIRKITPLWHQYSKEYAQEKEVYYFSVEILIGRLLGANLIALNAEENFREILAELKINLNEVEDLEVEPGLGNGGLGRLFACFLESMATLGLPGHGVSLFYRTGLMKQEIDPETGKQLAYPDHWDNGEHYGMVHRADEAFKIEIGGHVEDAKREDGTIYEKLMNTRSIHIVPWYIPVVGYENKINNLILLSTDVSKNLDNDVFDTYLQGNIHTNPLWKVMVSFRLYPSAKQSTGKWLRFVQEAVLALGGLHLIITKKIKALYPDVQIATLPLAAQQKMIRNVFSKLCFQINDTHPTLLVPGVMQILLDEYQLDWDEAWAITSETVSYTNHTVRPEALETWSIDLFKKVLPRHYSIVERIHTDFRRDVKKKFPTNSGLLQSTEVVSQHQRVVNMAHLAIVGSHSINGVARLHSQIIKEVLFKDFYQIYPERFNNKTNGITHRRFLLKANPELAGLLDKYISPKWRTEYEVFGEINQKKLADNEAFVNAFREVKQQKKLQLTEHIKNRLEISVDPNSLFDSHVKRFHEYKRQLMQLLHILVLAKEIEMDPKKRYYPRTFIFAGKAPEDYYEAKLTIQLIKYTQDILKKLPKKDINLVLIPNYNVTWAERIFTGSDLSEQIPKAGQEASGTGLFKALFNGALIIGTHDGANIEVAEAVGEKNIFLFGTKVEDLEAPFVPNLVAEGFAPLKEVLLGLQNHPDFNLFYRQLMEYGDHWAILRDFMEFYTLQEDLVVPFYNTHPFEWNQKAIRALGAAGEFSSDRTIMEYATEVWKIREKKLEAVLA